MIDLAEIIWGRNPTPVPPFLGKDPVHIGIVSILPQQLLIPLSNLLFVVQYLYNELVLHHLFSLHLIRILHDRQLMLKCALVHQIRH
ncbi:MAG: hypothetical protein HC788_12790 [Sphingopyxis sp.]|nr:hypothetical protein [Sphingopyxis sp.]